MNPKSKTGPFVYCIHLGIIMPFRTVSLSVPVSYVICHKVIQFQNFAILIGSCAGRSIFEI